MSWPQCWWSEEVKCWKVASSSFSGGRFASRKVVAAKQLSSGEALTELHKEAWTCPLSRNSSLDCSSRWKVPQAFFTASVWLAPSSRVGWSGGDRGTLPLLMSREFRPLLPFLRSLCTGFLSLMGSRRHWVDWTRLVFGRARIAF